MNPDIARVMAAFLSRVDLKGSEVPAYNACLNELSQHIPQDESPVEVETAEVKEEAA